MNDILNDNYVLQNRFFVFLYQSYSIIPWLFILREFKIVLEPILVCQPFGQHKKFGMSLNLQSSSLNQKKNFGNAIKITSYCFKTGTEMTVENKEE